MKIIQILLMIKRLKREKTELYDPEDYINNRNPFMLCFLLKRIME